MKEKLVSAIIFMPSIAQLLFMAFLSLLLQEVLFLEYHTEEQKAKIKKFFTIGMIVIIVIAIAYSCFFSEDGLGLVLFVASIYIVFFGLVIYSAYTGRKKYKWLAIFEGIPMYGFYVGIDNVFEIPQTNMNFIQENIYLIFMYLFLTVGIQFLIRKNKKFFDDLKKDIKHRSLAKWEEAVVWFAGIWLVIYSDVNYKILGKVSSYITNYLSILNLIVIVLVLLFVVTSNYREYYTKKNNELQRSLITAMADLVENRDENTGGHIQRTSRYVEIIARKLQADEKFSDILTDKYIENMVVASPLHDVGKIHIPDAVLNKPGKLDDEEFAMMKSHAATGGSIITNIEKSTGNMEYLNIAREMAEYHHERMDGKGYPHGLSGDDIPLCAKILAVADVFDALVSKRCYKPAMPLDKAFAIIKEESGDHFDVDVANAFLSSRGEVELCLSEFD